MMIFIQHLVKTDEETIKRRSADDDDEEEMKSGSEKTSGGSDVEKWKAINNLGHFFFLSFFLPIGKQKRIEMGILTGWLACWITKRIVTSHLVM